MYGAILGDIIGSPYEFDWNNIKTKDFPLFNNKSKFTDDTIMTIAVADAILSDWTTKQQLYSNLVLSLQLWGNIYPNESYGSMFNWWLNSNKPKPYNSFGNGAAMRVSSVGWLFNSLDETQNIARITASITHNHKEGLKGAESVASAIFLARIGQSKEDIKKYIEKNYNYNLNKTCNEIRKNYVHVESCQETVPPAIIAFLESTSFEDAIRNAVSLGGDSDTLTCITGSIAEAYYGISEELKNECLNRIPNDMKKVLNKFEKRIKER